MTGNLNIYLSEGKRFYAAAAAVTIVNLIFLIIFALPTSSYVDTLRKDYASLRKEIAQKKVELKNVEKSVAALDSMRDDLDLFVENLPNEVNMSKIVREFHNLAKKSTLSISSARYSPPIKEGEYLIKHDISFPVTGRYKNIRKFVYNLEKLPYLMGIDDLALTSKEDERNVSVTIKISLYLRAEV